mgnify:CR=1 FL=1
MFVTAGYMVGGFLDYTVIYGYWGYLSILISHPHPDSQSQSQSLDNYWYFFFSNNLNQEYFFVFTKNSQKAAARYLKMIKLSLFEAGLFMFIHHVMHQICFPKSTLELLYSSVDSEMQKII